MIEKLHVEDREIVVPGSLLAAGMAFLPSGMAFREGENLYSSTMGLVNVKGRVVKVIPLAGRYMPKVGDVIVGKIVGIGSHGWAVDIDCPFNADLNIGEATSRYIDTRRTDMSEIFDIGDYLLGKIILISEAGFVKVTTRDQEFHKLQGGNIIHVSPSKIPRIIGKAGSMISMIKDYTHTDVCVGQNGLVWIGDGEPEMISLVTDVVKKIEAESHISGLTDRVKELLEKKAKGAKPVRAEKVDEKKVAEAKPEKPAEPKSGLRFFRRPVVRSE